jgi:hypothetical protein
MATLVELSWGVKEGTVVHIRDMWSTGEERRQQSTEVMTKQAWGTRQANGEGALRTGDKQQPG